MEFIIDYDKVSHFENFSREIVLSEIPESELWYDYFQTKIIFLNKEKSLELLFDWVPIFGFIITINEFLENIELQPRSFYEFTEDDSKLHFEKKNTMIRIQFDFTNQELLVPEEDFKAAVVSLNEKFCNDLLKIFPTPDTKDFIREKVLSFSKIVTDNNILSLE